MEEGSSRKTATRHIVDGGSTLGLLAIAILSGYVILAPSPRLEARVRPVPVTVAAVVSTDRASAPGRASTPLPEAPNVPSSSPDDTWPLPGPRLERSPQIPRSARPELVP